MNAYFYKLSFRTPVHFGQGLLISDSEPVPAERITLCRKRDMLPDGDVHDLNVYRECIMPGTELTFGVTIDDGLFPYDTGKILAAVDSYYGEQRKKFLSRFGGKDSPELPESGMLFVGGGTGYVSKTVTYQMIGSTKRAAETVQDILSEKFRRHGHDRDLRKYGVTPHMRKCAMSGGRLYDQGLCGISFEEI